MAYFSTLYIIFCLQLIQLLLAVIQWKPNYRLQKLDAQWEDRALERVRLFTTEEYQKT